MADGYVDIKHSLENDMTLLAGIKKEEDDHFIENMEKEDIHIKRIEFGRYEIDTTCISTNSDDLNKESYTSGSLYVCEFCLKFRERLADLKVHMTKCYWTQPRGREIYRKDRLSLFEIDGWYEQVYCLRLCLLSKLFLVDKKYTKSVGDFVFYVLTTNDKRGKHMVGYFSKEKYPEQNHNMSCLLILPHHQRKGFGQFLIQLSYVLSRREGLPGTPEKPMSPLGWLSYHNYWKSVISQYIYSHMKEKSITIKTISEKTGIDPYDIAATLQMLNLIKQRNGSPFIAVKPRILRKQLKMFKRKKHLILDEKVLKWTPLFNCDTPTTTVKTEETFVNTSGEKRKIHRVIPETKEPYYLRTPKKIKDEPIF